MHRSGVHQQVALALLVAGCLSASGSAVAAEQAVGTSAKDAGLTKNVGTTRHCTTENQVIVCRDAAVVEPPKKESTSQQILLDVVLSRGRQPEKIVVVEGIPPEVLPRLSNSPDENRRYSAKRSWTYRAEPARTFHQPTKLRTKSRRLSDTAPWKYHPQASQAYHAKNSWTYHRDVYKTLWRQRLQRSGF